MKYKYPAKIWEKKLSKYWKPLEKIEDEYYKQLFALEKKMEKETGIKGIEFFHSDNSIVGIGNDSETMELIHRERR